MAVGKRVSAPFTIFSALFSALAVLSGGAGAEAPALEDVQVGERGDQTRIALICAGACSVTKRNDAEFLLRGANADFVLDLAERSDNVAELTAISAGGGSLLRVVQRREIDYANAKSCSVRGRPAACIDLFFTKTRAGAAAVRKEPAQAKPTPAPAAKAPPVLREPRVAAAPKPSLREGAAERLDRFAALTPPERLAPPAPVVLAKVQPVEEAVEVHTPSFRSPSIAPLRTSAAASDYAGRVRAILGKDLTAAYCDNAHAVLQADPWALGAMADVGLCAAAQGKAAHAEDVLSRLLEYTPDNYEAHVGRALIAAAAGEKSVARKYFQDALNALPPIAESDRIVEAMAAL